MPTQKIFKARVRARMTKTGESYTAARRQLLAKTPVTSAAAPEPAVAAPEPTVGATALPDGAMVSDASMVRATGKSHAAWFGLLDDWGATTHTHTEIARWLSETHGVPGWWTQNVTVAYERARGLRAPHQMRNGYSIGVTRTVDAGPEHALEAFTDAALRSRWLPAGSMRQRPTRAALARRFDWSDPPSRVVVGVVAKDAGRTVVSVTHERLPDADAADRLKREWRGWLGALKTELEQIDA